MFLFGASVIIVSFVGFGSYGAAALAAFKKRAKSVFFLASLHFVRFGFHYFLAFIKKFLCNRWLVYSLVEFSVEIKSSIVKRIFQKHLDIGNGKNFAASANQAQRSHFIS
ncbi:MAG: hypothetical protein WBC21_02920 [Minisyncoccales bacterium]